MLTASGTPSGGIARGDAGVVDGMATADRVLALHATLAAQPTLSPSPVVDAAFGALVEICVTTAPAAAEAAWADPRVLRVRPDLLRLCATGEALLETCWATRIADARDPERTLRDFPYLGNYRRLVRLELSVLAAADARLTPRSTVVFLGGGPLPLSALELHRATGARVVVLDRDPAAVDLARTVLDRLAPTGAVPVIVGDATDPDLLAGVTCGSDVVHLAALVGSGPEAKRSVLAAIHAATGPGTLLVARSADGLRRLLYPAVDLADVAAAGFVPRLLAHPLDDVVNSVLLARRPD